MVVRVLDYLRGYFDVFRKGVGGSVYHDGSKAVVYSRFAEFERVAVIEVKRYGSTFSKKLRADSPSSLSFFTAQARSFPNM